MPEDNARRHLYHAEASVLEGHLRLPLVQEIETQAYARLSERGGYLSQHENDYRLEGMISFRSAHTQVAGNRGDKPGHGWVTLATSVIEDLNVLDFVTADRVVAQLFVEHPLVGYVPTISFLGTRFENLKIAGHPVKLDFDPGLFSDKPKNDAPHTQSAGFLDRVTAQHARVKSHPSLLPELAERYTGFARDAEKPEAVECSLVNETDGAFPGTRRGHVIHIPDFATICLASVRLEQSNWIPGTGIPKKTTIQLTMIELKMGCAASGSAGAGGIKTNGTTVP